jgi:predicted ester cyclase
MSSAFPDLTRSIEDMIAEGDKVVTRSVMKGTHTGNLPNIPATNRQIDVECIVINRVQDGEIVEGWESYDSLGMYLQLEVIHMVSTLGKSRKFYRGDFPPLRSWPE